MRWEEIYTAEQIQKIQEIELENLRELKRVCDAIGVQFFVYGGSLIGAVRHQGFVPWDDDLDIGMLRADYDKFISEAPKHLSEKYYLQTPYSDKKTPYFYTKLRKNGTKCVEYAAHRLNIHHGIYVDIYPIDELPNEDAVFWERHKKYQKWIRLFVWRQNPYRAARSTTLKQRWKACVRYAGALVLRLVPRSFFIKKLDSISKKDNGKGTGRYGNYSFPKPQNTFERVLPFETAQFEGESVLLPSDWDGHLRRRYGDYMALPPEDERIGHVPYILEF